MLRDPENNAPDAAGPAPDLPPVLDTPVTEVSLPQALSMMQASLARIEERLGQVELRRPSAPAARTFALALPASYRPLWFQLALLATAMLVVFLRLVNLDQLQNEFYGDIALLYEYIAAIRAGHWPFYFTLSLGPLYAYVIMPVIAITGPTYFGFKLAAVLLSLGTLAATYALSRRLIDEHFAVVATLVAGVSSWLLVFSRLGNAQILVPLLTTCALWLVIRIVQGGGKASVIACAVISTLGLYVYPPSFVLAPVIGLTLLCLRWAGQPIRWADLWRFAITCAICALPLAWIIWRDPYNFFSGYIGGKLEGDSNPLAALAINLWRGLLAFHIYGDGISRSNPIGQPHLDTISGLLFLGGLVFWLLPERRRFSPMLLIPLILLQVPSWLVLNQPGEVPSASRTIGVAPIAYILVASGLWWLAHLRRPALPRWLAPALAGVLMAAILLLNVQRYFRDYIGGLPYQNTPIGRIITTYVDALPPDTQIYLVGCCWEHSMPEPLSIQYQMARPERFSAIDPRIVTCDWLQAQPQPAVLVWSFRQALPSPQVAACQSWLPAQIYGSRDGLPAFAAGPLRANPADDPAMAQPAAPSADAQLITTVIQLDGQPVTVRYSPTDMGEPANLFDQSDDGLLRGLDANPLVIELEFPQPRSTSALTLRLAAMQHIQITVKLTGADDTVTTVTRDLTNLGGIPVVELPLSDGAVMASQILIEILDLAPPADATHIHVRELQLH